MKRDSLLSIHQHTQKQLKDKKFLKKQVTKFAEKIKKSQQKTKDLRHVQSIYKSLLKGDPFYLDLYGVNKPVENPCKLCGENVNDGDSVCYYCQQKAKRKNRAMYQIDVSCSCSKKFHPKRIAIPFEPEDKTECPSCKARIMITPLELQTQIKVEHKTYSYNDISEVGKTPQEGIDV